jgi:hypothetical protein
LLWSGSRLEGSWGWILVILAWVYLLLLSLLPLPCHRGHEMFLSFFPFPHTFPVILNSFPNKLYCYLY